MNEVSQNTAFPSTLLIRQSTIVRLDKNFPRLSPHFSLFLSLSLSLSLANKTHYLTHRNPRSHRIAGDRLMGNFIKAEMAAEAAKQARA